MHTGQAAISRFLKKCMRNTTHDYCALVLLEEGGNSRLSVVEHTSTTSILKVYVKKNRKKSGVLLTQMTVEGKNANKGEAGLFSLICGAY